MRSFALPGLVAIVALLTVMPVRAQTESMPALNECVMELGRQGYRFLSTGPARQEPQGWRFEVRAGDRSGRVVEGVCVVDERTSTTRLSGFGAPYPGGGGGQMMAEQFECFSERQLYRECRVPAPGPVRLLRAASRDPCVEGRTWGLRGDRVWVDQGCRGVFEVTTRPVGPTGSVRPPVMPPAQPHVRGEALCRQEAQRQQVIVRGVSPFTPRGRYLEATVEAQQGRQRLRFVCHYYPREDRAQFVSSEIVGAPGVNLAEVRETCTTAASQQGFRVLGYDGVQTVPGGARMPMSLRDRWGTVLQGQCRYDATRRRAEIELARPRGGPTD